MVGTGDFTRRDAPRGGPQAARPPAGRGWAAARHLCQPPQRSRARKTADHAGHGPAPVPSLEDDPSVLDATPSRLGSASSDRARRLVAPTPPASIPLPTATIGRMPPRKKAAGDANVSGTAVTSIKYPAKRKNIPPAGLEAHGVVRDAPSVQYAFNPHLPPVLRSSPDPAAGRPTSRATGCVPSAAAERGRGHSPGRRAAPSRTLAGVERQAREAVVRGGARGTAHARTGLHAGDPARDGAPGRAAQPVRRPATRLRQGGAVLPARRRLDQPDDPRRLAAGYGQPCAARRPRRQGADDLRGPALRH